MKKDLSLHVEMEDVYTTKLQNIAMFPAYKMGGVVNPVFTFTKTLTAKEVVLSSVNGLVVFTDVDIPANTGTTITILAATTGIKRYTVDVSGDDAIKMTNPEQCSTSGFGSSALITGLSANSKSRIVFPLTEIVKFNKIDFNQVNSNSDPTFHAIIGDTFTLKNYASKMAGGLYNMPSLRGIYGDIANLKFTIANSVSLPAQNTFGNIYPILQEFNGNTWIGESTTDALLYPQYFFLVDTAFTKTSSYTKNQASSIKLYVDLGTSMPALLNWIATTAMQGLASLELYGTLTGSSQENTDIALIKTNNASLASTFKINGVVK